jgi:hypothetical protein
VLAGYQSSLESQLESATAVGGCAGIAGCFSDFRRNSVDGKCWETAICEGGGLEVAVVGYLWYWMIENRCWFVAKKQQTRLTREDLAPREKAGPPSRVVRQQQ